MGQDRLIWEQLRSLTAKDFIRALERDGWSEEERRGATRAFIKDGKANGQQSDRRRIVIHYHPRKTFQKKLLRKLIQDTGWTPADLVRLKLIRKRALPPEYRHGWPSRT